MGLVNLVKSRIDRRLDKHTEAIIRDRMVEFTKSVMASIHRNASRHLEGEVISNMIQKEDELSIFEYCHTDSIESCESEFGDLKRQLRSWLTRASRQEMGALCTVAMAPLMWWTSPRICRATAWLLQRGAGGRSERSIGRINGYMTRTWKEKEPKQRQSTVNRCEIN